MAEVKSLKLRAWQLIVMIGLSALLVFCLIAICINIKNPEFLYIAIISLIGYIGIVFYAVYGYKIPHGNSLKYIYLIFALAVGFYAIHIYQYYRITAITSAVAAVVIGFMSGRLDRDSENTFIITAVSFLFAVGLIAAIVNKDQDPDFWLIVAKSNFLVQFLFLSSAYLIRYAKHKEAGESK